MASLTIHHYLGIIDSFIKNIVDSRESYYMFVGRPLPWINSNGNEDDTAVPVASGSVYDHESSIYGEMAFGKMITSQDVAFMARRVDWVEGTVYDVYDQEDGDLWDKDFYVMNSSFEVYKCIDNGEGAPSTVRPGLNATTGTFRTSDGYIWKYMYTIPSNLRTKFMTSNYIPVVSNNEVANAAVGGTIDAIRLQYSGNNYKTYYSGYLTSAFSEGTQFNSYVVGIDRSANPVSNFYAGASMYLNAGFGAGQIRQIRSYDGPNRLVNLSEPFDSFVNFNLSNITGSFTVGDTITQNVDNVAFIFKNGYFQAGDTVVQSDTGANGYITAANSTIFKVIRNSDLNLFQQNFPIINTSDAGTLGTGTVKVSNLAIINISSNTGAFTVGEFVYQSNGTANTANGVVRSANSTQLVLGLVTGLFSNSFQLKGNTSNSNAVLSTVTSSNAGLVYVYSVPGSGTDFTTEYSIGDYIRVGANANNNVRRITAVNSTVIEVSQALGNTFNANVHYKTTSAALVDSIVLQSADGFISNVNLNGVKLSINTPSTLRLNFFIGEKVNMTDSSNTNQGGTTGIVSYANSTTLILTSVTGTFVGGNTFFARGDSTLQRAKISTVDSYPNLTIRNPVGNFQIGQPLFCRDSVSLSQIGSANIVSLSIIPNELTEYYIGPTVTIEGDGEGAKAFALVDNSSGTANSITQVVMIDPGFGYTEANVSITTNTSFVNAIANNFAVATAVISPANGHGSNTYAELGARYVGISVTFDTGENEGYKYPVYGKYRRVGIIENVLFDDITVNLDYFDRARLVINNVSGTGFEVGEYVYQPNTGTVGEIVFANSTNIEVKKVKGREAVTTDNMVSGLFSANGKFANGATSNDNIIGLTSETTANVSASNVVYFSILSDIEVVTEANTLAGATLVALNSNTQLKLTNVDGDFAANDTLYSITTNAYANVVSLYGSNGKIEITSNFAKKFNQTLRIPLTTNTAPFEQFETVEQEITLASGVIISNNNEYDIIIDNLVGSFSVGNFIENGNTGANAVCMFANSTYLRLTNASGPFYQNDPILNNLGATADCANVLPALVLIDIDPENKFQTGPLTANIVGLTSEALGKSEIPNVVVFPDLVRDSGTVIYMENMIPFELSNTSREDVKVIIKF